MWLQREKTCSLVTPFAPQKMHFETGFVMMIPMTKESQISQLSEQEIAERRDAGLKRALSMPHKPHKSPAKPKARKVKNQGPAKPKSRAGA